MKTQIIDDMITKNKTASDFYCDKLAGPVREKLLLEIREKMQWETLEEIIEDIGKAMCHFQLLYQNAWKWMIQDRWDWEYKGETLIEVFKEFRKEVQQYDRR